MKNSILFFLFIALLISCRDDSLENETVLIKGKVINDITYKPIANYPFSLLEKEVSGSGFFSIVKTVNSKSITTDENGNFSFYLEIFDRRNAFEVSSGVTPLFTPIVNSRTGFNYEGLVNAEKIFKVRNWEKLQIIVKNVNPYDENDQISVSLFERGTNFQGTFITKIENFGVKNIAYEYPASDNGLNPTWIGKDVNSIIHCDLQNDSRYIVFYNLKRNGVWTNGIMSSEIQTISGQPNIYELNY